MENRERVKWVDIAKCLGIFAIYLGHFGETAGKAHPFVFLYHVPLFFFLAGCMDSYDKEKNILYYIAKKFKSIMLPFYLFCFLSIIINVVQNDAGIPDIQEALLLVAKGNVRNTFFASSLWFLTCLFLMEIIFKIIKLEKYNYIIFITCLVIHLVVAKALAPQDLPRWYYNLDSALFYMLFFAIGYIAYPHIVEFLRLNTRRKKVIFVVTGVLTAAYSIMLFEKVDYINSIFGNMILFPSFRALLLIWLNLVIARLLENISLLSKIGRETLYLCGNEYIIKTLVPCLLGIFGLSCKLTGPLPTYLYVLFLLIICVKFFIPWEKKIITEIIYTLKK